MCISSLPDVSSEEVTHTTFPWQFVNGPDSANHRPGYFTQDKASGHSSHLVGQITKSIRGETNGAPSCAEPSGSAPDHMMHYHHDMWQINTAPPPPPHSQDAAYALTATNGTTASYRPDYSSSSDSHHGSHDSGSSVHFSDSHHPLSLSSASFTPINQNHSTAPFPYHGRRWTD